MNTSSFIHTLTHFRFTRTRIDIIRDPYRIWLWLCVIFSIFLIAIISLDFFIYYQLQTGQLVTTATSSQAPTPIISQSMLTKTAQKYATRATTLSALETATSSVSSSVDPSE